MARSNVPVRPNGPDGEPRLCPQCHRAQVEYVSEAREGTFTFCRPCEKAKAGS